MPLSRGYGFKKQVNFWHDYKSYTSSFFFECIGRTARSRRRILVREFLFAPLSWPPAFLCCSAPRCRSGLCPQPCCLARLVAVFTATERYAVVKVLLPLPPRHFRHNKKTDAQSNRMIHVLCFPPADQPSLVSHHEHPIAVCIRLESDMDLSISQDFRPCHLLSEPVSCWRAYFIIVPSRTTVQKMAEEISDFCIKNI